MESTEIIPYRPEHQPWFEKFNREWIEKFFWMEPMDHQILSNPEDHILKTGGAIFMALYEKELAGTVAIKKSGKRVYEMTKMAVTEKYQGHLLGRALAEKAISWGKGQNAERLFLYSSTKLQVAIPLYRKLGFVEIPVDGPYKRSDIKMELRFL